MKIGFFQYLPKFLSVKENLQEIKKLLEKNKKQIKFLDLFLFPEYFLSGPLKLDFILEYEKEISFLEIQNTLKDISKLYPSLAFVMGSVLLKKNGKYFNASLVIKNGKILKEYHKKALIYNENYICESDDKIITFNVGKIRVGLAICWDLILPEIFRKYTKKVDLIVAPSFWGIGGNALQSKYPFSLEKKYYDALGIARSYENACALLFVNSVGKYKSSFYSDRMMGGSYFVVPPLGLIYKTNNKNSSYLHAVKFDLNVLNQYREFYETDNDYFYYLKKKVI